MSAGDAPGGNKSISTQLMQNPELLAALQSKLDGLTGMNSDYIRSLPPQVKKRINALKYQQKMSELTQQRKKVVLGEYEPTETECEWNYDEEEDEDENQVKIEEVNEKSGEVKDETSNSEMKGIPDFWLT